MSESRGPRREGNRPASGGGRPSSSGRGRPAGDRRGKPDGDRRGKPDGDRRGKPDGDRRGRPPRRDARSEPERTAEQKVYDGPPIPDDVSASDLDKHARQALQGLPEKLVDKVARHLVMAGLLMAEDPETAHLHALAARARANRNGMIREACGETAYAAGKFGDALAEFRAARRMNGQQYYAPMMADCERALKRPEKAIAYDTPAIRSALDDAGQVELSIVVAGARRDLGQVEAALRLLETEPLHTKSRADWVARLRYAYADTLLAAGRREDAVTWFHRTVAVDGNALTDAQERLDELE
ncbi:tetratricopeptide repeat protein [Aeromicrobium marinum DSM 15272]|uniref:Tetratricopeptide repeat protein n=1 Tax=Aeromicrobium marinum DSM 15272 TaxID=585531 RepID=E2S9L1_9ACTN|nr:tetratricopeptide repeat protein [Aeromicrobium marinum]EFQ83935.1 tetratricopeptide repeat protein [Aeromicrobium marinum DSM 15272]